MRALLLTLVAAGILGCGGEMPPPPPVGSGRLELGTIVGMDHTFTDLTDGQDVPLIPGAQGGFHVWMKFRARLMAPGEYTMERRATRLSDGKLVLRTEGRLVVGEPAPQGYWEVPAPLPMFMCPTPIGISIIDQPITYTITLRTADGRIAGQQSITLVPHCDGTEFCDRICKG